MSDKELEDLKSAMSVVEARNLILKQMVQQYVDTVAELKTANLLLTNGSAEIQQKATDNSKDEIARLNRVIKALEAELLSHQPEAV